MTVNPCHIYMPTLDYLIVIFSHSYFPNDSYLFGYAQKKHMEALRYKKSLDQ